MTYKEFKEWCEDNGYDVVDTEKEINVSEEPLHLCSVSKMYRNSMETTSLAGLPEHLFHKVMELAMTPIREREEPKRYVVKVPKDDGEGFYALRQSGELLYMLHDRDPDLTRHYKLTEDQIMGIDGRFMPFAVEVK